MPPHSSERSLRAMPHPHRMPNINPASDKANDTNPMMLIGDRMDAKLQTPRKANETPTAKASMLVATANAATTFSLVGSNSCRQSSSLKDSIIIRPPRKAKMAKSYPMVYTFNEMAVKNWRLSSQAMA